MAWAKQDVEVEIIVIPGTRMEIARTNDKITLKIPPETAESMANALREEVERLSKK